MRIPQDIIETIRQQNDIVQIISEYNIHLKKVGRNYVSVCPFHKDKNPSFNVSPEKQLFRCFGCDARGTVFNFLMKMEGITYIEAVKKLAQRSGIKIPQYSPEDKTSEQRQKFYEINNLFAEYCFQLLTKNRVAKRYLFKRGLSQEIINEFKIGWCPFSVEPFIKLANEKNFSSDLLAEDGIIFSEGEGRGKRARFAERIIFPIFDYQGRIVGFGGRVLDKRLPKYINSLDTLVYHKSKNLYGIYQAISSPSGKPPGLTDFRQTKRAMICEGYLDVLMVHQYGMKNAVASLSTALTDEQILLLKRYVEEVILIYDADKGGEEGTLRGLERLASSGLRVKAATLPVDLDPDEFLRKFGVEQFQEVIKKALPLVDYRMELALRDKDLSRVEDKVEVINQVFPVVAGLSNLVEQREEIKKISRRLDVDEETLYLQLRQVKKSPGAAVIPEAFQESSQEGVWQAEEQLLQLILDESQFLSRVTKSLKIEQFTSPLVREIMRIIFRLYTSGKGTEIQPATLLSYFPQDETSDFLTRLALDKHPLPWQGRDAPVKEKMVDDLIRSIERTGLERKYEVLTREIVQLIDNGQIVPSEKETERKRITSLLKGSRGKN